MRDTCRGGYGGRQLNGHFMLLAFVGTALTRPTYAHALSDESFQRTLSYGALVFAGTLVGCALVIARLRREVLGKSREIAAFRAELSDASAALRLQNESLARVSESDLVGEDIELSLDLRPRIGSVRADAMQLQQVVLNLVVNARDAMPAGGMVKVETSRVEIFSSRPATTGAPSAAGEEIPQGKYSCLSVTDTGVGMTPDVLRRLFEPFFTTKEPGRGTGLGLSTVYGIVKQSGGYIAVDSTVGTGSSFRVFLPLVEEIPEQEEISRPSEDMPRGHEVILLVEDDEFVRQLVADLLTRQGYSVLVADRPANALTLVERRTEPIDLLLTDVVMPSMSGREVARRIRLLQPAIRVLYMSGYNDDAILHHGVESSEVDFISKPFALQALATRVREVLDAPARV